MPHTVADLIRAQARVMWWCDAGGHHGALDLERVANLRGADTVLTNRRPPCPVAGCPGRVTFKDHTRVFARSMDTIAVHDAEGWAWEERRRAELKALGYRLELGKWVAPGQGTDPGEPC